MTFTPRDVSHPSRRRFYPSGYGDRVGELRVDPALTDPSTFPYPHPSAKGEKRTEGMVGKWTKMEDDLVENGTRNVPQRSFAGARQSVAAETRIKTASADS